MRTRIPALLAAAAGVMVLLSACSSSGGAGGASPVASGESGTATAKTATLKVSCAPIVQTLPFHIADTKGFATKAGVKLDCVQVQSGPALSAALLSGGLNVGVVTPANLFPLLDKKQDLVIFGGGWNTNYWDILVRKGVSLPDAGQGWKGTMKDLKGKRIGVVVRGGAGESVARALFEQAGMSADSASYIPTGLPATTLAALKGKSIDAAITLEPGITLALQQGIATQPFSIQKGTGPKGMVFADQVMVASRSYAEKNKASLCKLITAWNDGLSFVENPANRAAVDADAVSYLGLNASQAKALIDRNVSFYPKTAGLYPSTMDPAFAFQKQYSGASKAYTVADIGMNVCS